MNGNGNFENSKLFEGLVILNNKQNKTIRRKKKVHRIIGSFFLSLSDVLLMLMTDFPQRTALNHCRWCGMEDNRCGRHVLDNWRRRCVGDNRCGRHVLDHWRRRCVWQQVQAPCTRSPEKLTWGVRQKQASWNVSWQRVSWTDRVLTDETRLAPLVRILWHLHLTLRQLGLVVDIVEGNVDLWWCFSDTTRDQETGSGVTLPREPAFQVLVHFSGRLRLCTNHMYLSRSVGTWRQKEIEQRCLERAHTQLAVRSCSASRCKSCSCRRSLWWICLRVRSIHASYHFVFTKAACTDLYRNFSSSKMP